MAHPIPQANRRSGTRLVALGNGVWLDEIRQEACPPIKDVPGGSVTFATLGARLFTPEHPQSIALIFNAGYDFPPQVIAALTSWGIDLTVQYRRDQPSARGVVLYETTAGNRKGFQRITEPLPVELHDLPSRLKLSKAFHLFGTAEYVCIQLARFYRETARADQPLIVWEPQAKACRPDTLSAHVEAARLVDVFSPNHEELASFFNDIPTEYDETRIERQAAYFLEQGAGKGGKGCMIVRAAGRGCLVMSKAAGITWLAPYHNAASGKVIDTTGAGNTFLGALIVGWQETGTWFDAACYGQVAASFAIEQVGLPTVVGQGVEERWNECSVMERLRIYRQRLLTASREGLQTEHG